MKKAEVFFYCIVIQGIGLGVYSLPHIVTSTKCSIIARLHNLERFNGDYKVSFAVFAVSIAEGSEVRCTRDHFNSALTSSATCRPRDKVIRLDPPGNLTVETMTPLYISVQKCGGACSSTSQSCVPTKQRKRIVPVIIGSCGVESGICDKQCHQLEIMEDEECHCNCLEEQVGWEQWDQDQEEQKQCGPGKEFKIDSCSCMCQDVDAAKSCKDSGRVWNTDSCTCGCPLRSVVPCSLGLSFDNETCTCTDVIIREDRQSAPAIETRVPRSQELIGNVPYVIIAVMSGALLILIFALVVVIRTNCVLRSKLEAKNLRYDPGTDPSYVRCANPIPDESKSYMSHQECSDKYEQLSLLAELRGNSCVETKLSMENAASCAPHHSPLTAESPVYSSIQRVPRAEAGMSPKGGLCLSSFQDDPYTKLLDSERQDKSNSIDSNDSNPESGFDSVGGSGNGSTKSDDGVGGGVHHPHSRKHDQHLGVHHHNNPNDRQFHMSNNYVRINTLISTHSNSNPSVYSVVSRETPV